MKHIIYMLWFVVVGATAAAQTKFDITMTVDSVQRQFIVVRPSGPAPAGGYPVVFMFHGTSGDGEKFYNISGWKEKGEEEKFITVFPSSLEYCIIDSGKVKRTTKWNNGELQRAACPGQTFKDDVHFVRRIVDTLIQTFSIDQSRIYASGFSNGAGFANKLAIEMGDVLAAVTAVAAPLDASDSATPIRKIPVWFVFGDEDRNLGGFQVPFNDSCLIVFGHLIRRHLGAASLSNSFTKTATPITLTYLFTTPLPGTTASQFTFTLAKGLAHQYPNDSNYVVAAADIFWEFFTGFRLSLGIDDVPIVVADEVQVYPNPAQSYVVVGGEGEMVLSLHTMLGERVFTITAARGERIQLPALAGGVYVADIADGKSHTVTMIVLR